DRHAADQTIGDTGDSEFGGQIKFSPDGRRIYFLASDTGNTHLFYAPVRGGAPTRITKKPMHIKAFSLSGKCSTAAIVMTDLKRTPELYTIPTAYGADNRLKRLTGVNDTTCGQISFGKTKEVWFTSFDGTRLQGWMAFPPNFNLKRYPNKKYPSILYIHGGPRVQYGNSFFHEMNYLAARGYVVFYTNPRGGNGRGETFAASIVADWGDLDYKDVMAAADYMEKQPFINKKRIGATGGSYGGYMTNWLIGHTNRFRAAVTQRCVSELSNFVGSSDIGYDLQWEFGGQPWENPENYKQCSPLTHIGKHVKTPLLIIHSENDLRCDKEQAMQMFVKLKWLGKKVEMVWFPEEPHGLSRHGRPDRRVARLHWISKWFDRYLK
ncbi:MAG: S9 family peptidase, partial [candidate division Zixibacteria bacterium]|nr:S9 family peptidase [candidate division Zixibacteria bacterium]